MSSHTIQSLLPCLESNRGFVLPLEELKACITLWPPGAVNTGFQSFLGKNKSLYHVYWLLSITIYLFQ